MLTIVSWNVEDLKRLLEPAGGLASWHRKLGLPDVLCLQELRVREQDVDVVDRIRDAIPGWSGAFSLNRDAINARFRGGRVCGVGTWTRAALAGECLRPVWDREGRILVTRLPTRRLAIVNVYAVNGTARPYYDPDTGRAMGDRHAFKRRLIRRLAVLARKLQAASPLVLIGDWNISQTGQDTVPRLRTEEPHALARREFADEFVAPLRLVDVFRHRQPTARQYTWFNPRAHRLDAARVDFALVSEQLVARATEVSIDAPEATRTVSDHVPIRLSLGDNSGETA